MNKYSPDEVFSEADLKDWALDNGFIEDNEDPEALCSESSLIEWAENNGYIKEGE